MANTPNHPNPYMSNLPLRDYIAMELVLNEIKSGKPMNDLDLRNLVYISHSKATEIVDNRYHFLIEELDGKIAQADQMAENKRIADENARVLASFTPAKIAKMQADFSERKELEKRGIFIG